MEYVFTFLEGIASFVSPCLLPMIPIYIAYFVGKEEQNSHKAVINATGFVLGFTTVFVLLAVFASQLGRLISSQMRYFKVLLGILIILFGLNYMDLLNIKFFNKIKMVKNNTKDLNFIKSFLFGILFSVSWTPCIGTFLSSALLLVARRTGIRKRNFVDDCVFDWIRDSIFVVSGFN